MKHFGWGVGREPFIRNRCRYDRCVVTASKTTYDPLLVDAVVWNVRSRERGFPAKR